ncbi:hypothetical protein FWP46_12740 [Vibrio alginolyticus]|uniref:hypothetical protein n=1 Tax=Vibrio alginolyticus TaxID=663 RepID=UPI0037545F9E|nr:hypothetical protein [Vibrio alginolyticus]
MSFNFRARLETGKEASVYVEASRKEISQVLNQLKLDLSEFLRVELDLLIKDEIELKQDNLEIHPNLLNQLNHLKTFNPLGPKTRIKTGYKTVSFQGKGNNSIELFHLREGQKVYPLNIKNGINKFIASNSEELVEIIGTILEDPKTYAKLAKLKAFASNENEGF